MRDKLIIIICVVLLCVSGTLIYINNKNNSNEENEETVKTDAVKFKEEYEYYNGMAVTNGKTYRALTISKDNPFIYKTEDEIVNMINDKKTFAVYFGYSTCSWSRSVIEELIKVSKDLNISTIYYVNIKPNGIDIRDIISVKDDSSYEKTKEGTTGYNKLLELLDSVLSKYELKDNDGKGIDVKEKRIYTPSLVSIVNGVPTKLDNGIASDQDDEYMELTDEMKKETYSKFEKVLKEIKSGICDFKEAC